MDAHMFSGCLSKRGGDRKVMDNRQTDGSGRKQVTCFHQWRYGWMKAVKRREKWGGHLFYSNVTLLSVAQNRNAHSHRHVGRFSIPDLHYTHKHLEFFFPSFPVFCNRLRSAYHTSRQQNLTSLDYQLICTLNTLVIFSNLSLKTSQDAEVFAKCMLTFALKLKALLLNHVVIKCCCQ